MSLHPILLRGENFDGGSISIIDNNVIAGTDSSGVHRILIRNSTTTLIGITSNLPGGGINAAVQLGFTTATGFFGSGQQVDRNGLTIGDYVEGLEWRVSELVGLWYEIAVPLDVWSSFGSSQSQYHLTGFPGSGTNRYRIEIRRGSSTIFNRQFTFTS